MGTVSIFCISMEGIASELKRAGIIQNEMKSGEGYNKARYTYTLYELLEYRCVNMARAEKHCCAMLFSTWKAHIHGL